MIMNQETRDKIVKHALDARTYLGEGRFDAYTEALNKLWNTIDEHRFTEAEGHEVLEVSEYWPGPGNGDA